MGALPPLTSPRLHLRERSAAHLDALVEMVADPSVVRFLSDGKPRTAAQQRTQLIEHLERVYPPGMGYWSVFATAEPDRFLGWVCLRPFPEYDEIEIGYCLAPGSRGLGYATEAGRACLDYGFSVLELDEIVAVVDPANDRSQSVIARLGFIRDGVRTAYGRQLYFYRLARPT